jgi:hypothetical protein
MFLGKKNRFQNVNIVSKKVSYCPFSMKGTGKLDIFPSGWKRTVGIGYQFRKT